MRDIEITRDRLGAELRELEQRLPRPAMWAKRLLVGGGVGATVLAFAWRRRKRKKEEEARAPVVNTVIHVLPEGWTERMSDALEDGRWKPWAAGAAGAWVLLRVAELRQLRRLNRAMLTR